MEAKTIEEWKDLIDVERQGSGKDVYFTAECPVCLKIHSVDVLGSDASAKALAVGNIKQHMQDAHSELISINNSGEVG